MTSGVEPRTVQYILSQIDSGFMFEDFAKEFIASTDGVTFIPIGGVKDKGIDGLEFTYSVEGLNRKIYQFSKEGGSKEKIKRTIAALETNSIDCQRLVYVTNLFVQDQNDLIDEFFEKDGVFVEIRDIQWISVNTNSSPQTLGVFRRFEENYIHTYKRSNIGLELLDVKDPRIYTYLRQQLDEPSYAAHLDELLIDALIYLALDDTDPNEGKLCSREEIHLLIEDISNFDKKWLSQVVDTRLGILSAKPIRRIRHHTNVDKFCLPYETRVELAERQIDDRALYDDFNAETEADLRSELKEFGVRVQEPNKLLDNVFHQLFSQQGLEFAQFVNTGDGSHSIDKSLRGIVSDVVQSSSVIPPNREAVESALINTIRRIIYYGSTTQLEFLRRLADTYRMLFLLQCDPQLARYFEVMAGRLKVYVDTSILIPAMSEFFLAENNKRFTNLLLCARDAGIDLIVNRTVLSELSGHLRSVQRRFFESYEHEEEIFSNEIALVYIPEILIRAYFYAKLAGRVETFREFFEYFVSWQMTSSATAELIEWLKEAFGIRYEETTSLELEIDSEEEERLFDELKNHKHSEAQARTDAKQLLMIYALREKNNELGEGGVFGYSTWWLTSDIKSQEAFKKIADEHSKRSSPYMRTDFLYNYISLAPSQKQIKNIFGAVFPTLLGVNISFHVPDELCTVIQGLLRQYNRIVDTPRFKGELRSLTEKLKSDPDKWDKNRIELWFKERAKEIHNGNVD